MVYKSRARPRHHKKPLKRTRARRHRHMRGGFIDMDEVGSYFTSAKDSVTGAASNLYSSAKEEVNKANPYGTPATGMMSSAEYSAPPVTTYTAPSPAALAPLPPATQDVYGGRRRSHKKRRRSHKKRSRSHKKRSRGTRGRR